MLPLSGIRIIAVEQYGAGPHGTMFLADLGAEVIKIENHAERGEMGRHVGPHFFAEGDSHFFQSLNRNKRSVCLNLKVPEARGVLHDLVRHADGLLDNLRGDQPEKLGLTYDDMKEHNPAIVCAHLSAYGREGARKAWPGFDYLMQAEAGYLSVTGEPDGPPARFGLSIVDYMTGIVTALGLVSGILGTRQTGVGHDVDVSLFDVALSNLGYLAAWYLNEGVNQGREARSGHPSIVPSQLYRTEDGWIFIMCNKEKFWGILCDALGRPEWKDDAEFATPAARLRNRTRVTQMLDEVLMTRTTDAWLAEFGGKIPAAPVRDVAGALDNPLVREEGRLMTLAHSSGRPFQLVGNPMRVPGEVHPNRPAPALGADTDAVLEELGYDAARRSALRRCGAIH